MSEWDYIIVGDEPAGLWLLQKLATQVISPLKIGWLNFNKNISWVNLPIAVARSFEIPISNPFSPEIVTPKRTFRWNSESLPKQFPLLQNDPRFYCFADGLWKFFCRAKVSPPSFLADCLNFTEWMRWVPSVPDAVERICLSEENILESFSSTGGKCEVGIAGIGSIRSRHWVFNDNFRPLLRFIGKNLPLSQALFLNPSVLSDQLQYRFVVSSLREGIPEVLQPLFFYLDSEEFPERWNEVWPIEFTDRGNHRELAIWVSALRATSLEALSERFRQALKRLNRLFPFLSEYMISLEQPLSLESCFSQADREYYLSKMEKEAREIYCGTTVQLDTRYRGISNLASFFRCQLVYPLGPLVGAQVLWEREQKFQANYLRKNKNHATL